MIEPYRTGVWRGIPLPLPMCEHWREIAFSTADFSEESVWQGSVSWPILTMQYHGDHGQFLECQKISTFEPRSTKGPEMINRTSETRTINLTIREPICQNGVWVRKRIILLMQDHRRQVKVVKAMLAVSLCDDSSQNAFHSKSNAGFLRGLIPHNATCWRLGGGEVCYTL